jgi:hypothetical protein
MEVAMDKSREDWKAFEKLVAAIHIAKTQGGKVKWNDNINGRQFDVSIRFKYGAYEYLTVIECRDYKTKVPVCDVEAFVTKSKDVNANKAIIITSCGFQKGCFSVAKRHGIELLILDEEYIETSERLSCAMIPMLNISNIVFLRSDCDGEYAFPNSIGGHLLYLAKKAMIDALGKMSTIEKIINHWQIENKNLIDNSIKYISMNLPSGATLIIPPKNERIPVKEMRFSVQLVGGRKIDSPGLDPLLDANKLKHISIKSPDGNLVMNMKASAIPIGFDTPLKEGSFYVQPDSDFKYYCEKINGDKVRWILIESYQHGKLIQVKFTQEKNAAIKSVSRYLLIEDKREISRLKELLSSFL